MENLVTITIRSTHYYVIEIGQGKLMVDAGWPDSLAALKSQLQRYDLTLAQIRFVLLTHHHPDHAGLAQEIKHASHARLILLESQVPYLDNLKTIWAGKGKYEPIRIAAGDVVLPSSNRATLKALGIRGEIVETRGHSDDSVSLVLDSGMAFIGDLHLPDFEVDEAREATCESWKRLLHLNARMIYPAHGNPYPVDAVKASLSLCDETRLAEQEGRE